MKAAETVVKNKSAEKEHKKNQIFTPQDTSGDLKTSVKKTKIIAEAFVLICGFSEPQVDSVLMVFK